MCIRDRPRYDSSRRRPRRLTQEITEKMSNQESKESIPVGELGIIPLESCAELGAKVNNHIVSWRETREREDDPIEDLLFGDYHKDNYLVKATCSRFGSGEAKGTILESVRGTDLYILVDVTNYSITYSLCGHQNRMSPDDHFQNLKRIIAAAGSKPRRVTVIMPFLYESRQHKRSKRESLDCALALQELQSMGVTNIITFDAHDPRAVSYTHLDVYKRQLTSFLRKSIFVLKYASSVAILLQ